MKIGRYPGGSNLIIWALKITDLSPFGSRRVRESKLEKDLTYYCWLKNQEGYRNGQNWGQKEKRASEDEMTGWHHWCNGHELGQTLGGREGQKGLACCSPWSQRVGHDWVTEKQYRNGDLSPTTGFWKPLNELGSKLFPLEPPGKSPGGWHFDFSTRKMLSWENITKPCCTQILTSWTRK